MSWLARSLVNSLRAATDDGGAGDDREAHRASTSSSRYKSPTPPREEEKEEEESEEKQPGTPSRGVKEDLSELTQTLSRQFWGVASFLAPPPAASSPLSDPPEDLSQMAGIRSDFAELGGRVRSGISLLSSNMAVSEISKIASTFLPFGSEKEAEAEDEEDWEGDHTEAVGVTEEVLAFARNISMHPETWLDFPLLHDDEDPDDFDMSDTQQEHALVVEHLVPRLAALRIELCPSHMSEGWFWKIYFVLLHPRLNKQDAELLSTAQIVEASTKLQHMRSSINQGSERSKGGVLNRKEVLAPLSSEEHNTTPPSESTIPKIFATEESTSVPVTNFETEKHPVLMTEVKIIDKSVIKEDPPIQTEKKKSSGEILEIPIGKYEDGDEWLEEDTGEMSRSGVTRVSLGNEEDVSFSDLEEDDNGSVPKSSKTTTATDSQEKDSRGWVQLNKSSGSSAKGGNSSSPQTKESHDWLDIDDIDAM